MKAPADPDRPTEGDIYKAAGCEEIWDYFMGQYEKKTNILPPSFETFQHGYSKSMCGSPEEYAQVFIRSIGK